MNIPPIAQKYLDEVTRPKYNKDFVILSKRNPDLLLKIITPIVMLFNKKFNTGFITILFGKMWMPYDFEKDANDERSLQLRYSRLCIYSLKGLRFYLFLPSEQSGAGRLGSGGCCAFCSWHLFQPRSECGLNYELTELIYYLERRYTNTTTYNLASKRSISPRTLLVQTIISLGHSRITFLRC